MKVLFHDLVNDHQRKNRVVGDFKYYSYPLKKGYILVLFSVYVFNRDQTSDASALTVAPATSESFSSASFSSANVSSNNEAASSSPNVVANA